MGWDGVEWSGERGMTRRMETSSFLVETDKDGVGWGGLVGWMDYCS